MAKGDWFTKFEWRRWKSDSDLALASAETRGVWFELLCCMFEKDSDRVTGTPTELARLARVSDCEMQRALEQFRALQIAECNTNGNGSVTVVCRFLKNARIARENTAKRVAKHRQNRAGNEKVTTPNSNSNSKSNSQSKTEDPPIPPAGGIVFPLQLQSDAFALVWAEWLKYRRELRKPMKQSTIDAQLSALAAVGEEAAMAAIRTSIKNGWTGLFPEKANGLCGPNQANSRPSSEDARRAADRAQRVGGDSKPAVKVY